jgi:hypothetical protein
MGVVKSAVRNAFCAAALSGVAWRVGAAEVNSIAVLVPEQGTDFGRNQVRSRCTA